MANELREILERYFDDESAPSIYEVNGELAIIDNPKFSIIPNSPYRNPLVVAVYCTSGSGKGRVNTRVFDL
ncbi:MAG: hypothetical protein II216_00575, partial [Alistipes sp.]|nr:hypothetical protein [Alistipes sp.]